ncbi:hypothetical protein LTR29_010724 [Friedmanniomyces endolithicus]|nr:hypothetical protein LTR29_010724 [Friedmanniomyces endolithicus]
MLYKIYLPNHNPTAAIHSKDEERIQAIRAKIEGLLDPRLVGLAAAAVAAAVKASCERKFEWDHGLGCANGRTGPEGVRENGKESGRGGGAVV